jgi:predicted metalloprotease
MSRHASRGLVPRAFAGRARLAAVVVAAAAVVALTLWLIAGGARYDDPLGKFRQRPAGNAQSVGAAPDRGRDLERFLTFVVNDVQGFWAREFKTAGLDYVPAQVVAFTGPARSPCGPASAQTGPFYCQLDHRIYLDVGFFRVLAGQFRAPGDFAQAYVVAHEVGHHVQALLGVMAQAQEFIREGAAPPNVVSIAQELQADCMAGVWAHSTYDRGLLERGDVEEALRAAAAVGDDRIQRRVQGRVNPETWTHGSAEQRREWLARGFAEGAPSACDTFSRIL